MSGVSSNVLFGGIKVTENITKSQRQEIQAASDSKSIFLSNVSVDITPEIIEEYFEKFGLINRITVVNDTHHKGSAHVYIEFDTIESMNQALTMDKSLLNGKIITVAKKRTNMHSYKKRRSNSTNTDSRAKN